MGSPGRPVHNSQTTFKISLLCYVLLWACKEGAVCGFGPQENALTGMAKAFVLGQNIHDGMVGSGRFAVGGGAVLCRFGVSHWIKTGRETANRMKGWRVARAGRPKRMAHSAALNRMKRARSFVSFFMMGASFRFMVWICKNSFILV